MPQEPDGLFELPVPGRERPPSVPVAAEPAVVTLVKADLRCASVAAASVLAKVERDGIMVNRAGLHPEYAWQENKGYSAPEHVAALRRAGPCTQHRRSWSLPLVGEDPEAKVVGADPEPEIAGGAPVAGGELVLEIAELEPAELEIAELEPAELEIALSGAGASSGLSGARVAAGRRGDGGGHPGP